MSARRERKLQRRNDAEMVEVKRERRKLRGFAELKEAVAEERVSQMSDAERARIEASLDPEAASMFRGIMGLTAKAKAQLDKEEPTRIDPFATARVILQHVTAEEYEPALALVRAVADSPDVLPAIRTPLVRAGQGLFTLASDAGKRTLDPDRRAEIVATVHERLSDVIAAAARKLEGMVAEDFDFVEQVEVNLPEEVTVPCHADDVPLVVLPDRPLRRDVLKARPLTSGVYLVECRMIGVPVRVAEDARLLAANAYALATFGAQVSEWPLTRPDSDGVWFPLFPQAFVIEQAQFPDQARRYYGDSGVLSDEARVQRDAKQAYLRGQREQFERDHAGLYRDLQDALDELEDLKASIKTETASYMQRTGRLPSAAFAFVEAALRARIEADVAACGLDFLARNVAQQRGRADIARVRAQQNLIAEQSVRRNALRKRVTLLENAIAEAKRLALNPHHAAGDAFLTAVGLAA